MSRQLTALETPCSYRLFSGLRNVPAEDVARAIPDVGEWLCLHIRTTSDVTAAIEKIDSIPEPVESDW